MPRPVRVLVVDDTLVVRKLVADLLAADAGVEVVGTASDGLQAVEQAKALRPDVVVLDVEMPRCDGLTALPQILAAHPAAKVVMFSTLTEAGARATLDALALGACDWVTKPSGARSVTQSLEIIGSTLLPKVLALGRRVSVAAPPVRAQRRPQGRVDVLVIASSTGGPNALQEVVPLLPAGLTVPVVIAQHMPPVFTRLLAERLDARSPLSVREAEEGDRVEAGSVLIAPGDRHLEITTGAVPRVHLTQAPPENSVRPAADVTLRTAVARWRSGVLAVVLTGMGYDGKLGCRVVVDAGGHVIAQDEATSVVWGMPGAVADIASEILPLDQIAGAVVRRAGVGALA